MIANRRANVVLTVIAVPLVPSPAGMAAGSVTPAAAAVVLRVAAAAVIAVAAVVVPAAAVVGVRALPAPDRV